MGLWRVDWHRPKPMPKQTAPHEFRWAGMQQQQQRQQLDRRLRPTDTTKTTATIMDNSSNRTRSATNSAVRVGRGRLRLRGMVKCLHTVTTIPQQLN